MGRITLTCPNGHQRELDDGFAGARAVCDQCGHVWTVPSPSSLSNSLVRTADHAPPQLDGDDTIPCPACAEMIKAAAKVCRFCGASLATSRGRRKTPDQIRFLQSVTVHAHHHSPTQPPKNPGVAAVLAFFYDGLGHIYCGQIGLAFLLIGLAVLWIVAIYGAPILVLARRGAPEDAGLVFVVVCVIGAVQHIWQIADAYAAAERANRGVTTTSTLRFLTYGAAGVLVLLLLVLAAGPRESPAERLVERSNERGDDRNERRGGYRQPITPFELPRGAPAQPTPRLSRPAPSPAPKPAGPIGTARLVTKPPSDLSSSHLLWYRSDKGPDPAHQGLRARPVKHGQRVVLLDRMGREGNPDELFQVRTAAGEEGWIERMRLEKIVLEE